MNVRITTDLFQQTTTGNDSFYRGWVLRAKYAYLQYQYIDTPDWKAQARLGLLQTVFIEHDEVFWPRWISTSPTERAGYFSSADAGLSSAITLPKKMGEVYATITNGPGYTSREIDRFKDYAARLTLTPWAGNSKSMLKTLALTAWGSKGAIASRFVNGGTGQIGTVGEGLDRDRWGITREAQLQSSRSASSTRGSSREGETGANTPASPRAVVDSSGLTDIGLRASAPRDAVPEGPENAPLLSLRPRGQSVQQRRYGRSLQ